MPDEPSFARLVSLACHDLRTPLATVQGFARTIPRVADLAEQPARHLQMIDEAASEMAALLDQLAVVARIERGAYEPNLVERDSLELARAAADRVDGKVVVEGEGAGVLVDADAVEHSLAALARALIRHGGLDEVRVHVRGAAVAFEPVTDDSRPVVSGEELKDLGSAIARRAIEAGGGTIGLDLKGEVLGVVLATEEDETAGGP